MNHSVQASARCSSLLNEKSFFLAYDTILKAMRSPDAFVLRKNNSTGVHLPSFLYGWVVEVKLHSSITFIVQRREGKEINERRSMYKVQAANIGNSFGQLIQLPLLH